DVVLEAFPESAEELGCLGEGECRYEVKRRPINEPMMRIGAESDYVGCVDAAASTSTRVAANAADAVCDEAVQKILAGLEDRSKPYRQTVEITVSELAGSDDDEDGLGLPGIVFDSGGSEAEASLLAAASVGHVFHEMLQHIAYDREPAEEQARILRDFAHRMDAAAARSFEPALAAFMNSSLAADLRASEKSGRPIYRELPFFYRVRHEGRELGSVKGQVDLLFEAPDGKWVLVDYKTTMTQKSEHHRQLAIYAFCLKKLLKGRPHRASLYYSRSGELVPVDLSELDDAGFESGLINRFEERSAEILS
nr:PD-(D/E)XK nuclease family protein [Candidatus Omnitrophota bacterium]